MLNRLIGIFQTLFLPSLIVDQLREIPLEYLYDSGYKVFFLDVDNTLLGTEAKQVPLDVLNWVQSVKGMGFEVVVLSNNSSRHRINRICDQLGVRGYYRAMKPLPFTLYTWCRDHKISPSKTVVVGDQVFTDIVLGQWVRGYSVLIEPVDKKFSLIKSIQREIELKLLAILGAQSDK
jgi:uncharacterized protein